MPILPATSTYSGGASDNNLYLRAGQPVVLPSGSTLTSAVNLQAADGSSTGQLYVQGTAAGAYKGAISLQPGTNAASAQAGTGITIRTIAGAAQGTGATTVEIGANAQGPNHLYIAGLSGTSEVYDATYNAPIKAVPVFQQTFALSSAVNNGLYQKQFTVPATGWYMFQFNMNLANADLIPFLANTLPAGAIEWTITRGGVEQQYFSSTISADTLTKAGQLVGTAEPMDYSFSLMGYLQVSGAQNDTQLNVYALLPQGAGAGATWSIGSIQARLVQMC